MRVYLFTAILLSWLGCTAFAQAPAKATFPKFYGGVSYFVGNYRVPYPRLGSYDEGLESVSLTAGYQFTSKLAVQASWAKGHDFLASTMTFHNAAGKFTGSTAATYDHWITTVPLLLRYTGTQRLQHRIQFDILGGLTLLRSSYRYVSHDVDSLQIPHDSEKAEQTTQAAFTVGLGIRYRLGQHLEAVGDTYANRTFSSAGYGNNRFVGTYAIGLRYRFGYR